MALYRNVSINFWSDSKVLDDFTPADKLFYLYLFTNPHTNLAGCYEISIRQMSNEIGYTVEKIEKLIQTFERKYRIISYSQDNKEVLLINWHKYNWTSSEKFRKPLQKEIDNIKTLPFKEYLEKIYNGEEITYGIDTVSIPYPYGIDTTVTDTDIYSKSLNNVNPIKESISKDIYILLNESDIDNNIKNSLKEWIEYKKEQFGFTYKPKGFKKFITEVKNKQSDIGTENVILAIDLSMGRGYQGIIWDLVNKASKSSSPYMDSIKNRVDVVDNW